MIVVLTAILFQLGEQDANWSQYGGKDRDFIAPVNKVAGELSVAWRQPLGAGTSGVVSNGTLLYTMSIRLKPGSKLEGEELVSAHELNTGRNVWSKGIQLSRLKGQESFSGDPIRPQATPALHRGCLCTLGYTGVLSGWEANTGKLLWQYDLVKELGAKPVQFGFASSPLIYQDSFVVHVGGSQTVLIRVDAVTGKVLWKSEPGEPSYASPMVATMEGEPHLVQVTRDAILGIHPDTGKTLWKYAMPETGLTNVPTPLSVKGNRLLVSGQGIKGTRLLQFAKSADQWQINEVWHNSKVTFFYCNWQIVDIAIFGNANKIMLGLNLTDGKELWRERGFSEANLVRMGSDHYLLNGDGKMTRCRLSPTGVEVLSSLNILSMRCWTPPTPSGDLLLLRDQNELVAVRWCAKQ